MNTEILMSIFVAILFGVGLLLGFGLGVTRNLEKDNTIYYNDKEYRIISVFKKENSIILNVYKKYEDKE